MFKIGVKGSTSTKEDMKTIADCETFSLSMDNNVEELTKDIDKKIKDFESENKEPTTVEELTSQIDKKIQKLEEEK